MVTTSSGLRENVKLNNIYSIFTKDGTTEIEGARGLGLYGYYGCMGSIWGVQECYGNVGMAPPHGILINKLPAIEADELRVDASCLYKNHCPHNKSNISKEEYKAIKELMMDHSRVVLTADKVVAMAVMEKQDIMDKAFTILTYTSTYNTINKGPTTRLRRKLISTLKDM